MVTRLAIPDTVDPPEVAIPQTGLVATADKLGTLTVDTTHQMWENGGVQYRPIAAGPGGVAHSVRDWDHTGADVFDPAGLLPDAPDPLRVVTAYPFIVEADDGPQSTFGWTAENYGDRAKARLKALESKIIEREFWTGEVAQEDDLDPDVYDWLAKASAIDLTPGAGAVSPKLAMAILEEALGDVTNGVGTFHLPKRAAVMSPDRWSEGPIVVWPDTSVVVGSGYDGTGPDGSPPADGEQWVYATDRPAVRLGPVEVFPSTLGEALDRSKNTLQFRAERFAAVSWDGNAHFAIRVITTT